MKNDLMFWAWWAWEPISFYKLTGSVPGASDISDENLNKWYDSIHSEKTIAAMHKIGINCAITHFYKGFGLEFEKKEMQRTAKLVSDCHKYGIKVFGYTQYGSIFHETFFKEVPEAVNWIQVDKQGQPLLWWGAEYRYLPCINRSQFTDYLKKCIKYGIEKIGLDGLHFDNFYSRPCYCDVCRQKFRDYLNENYVDKLNELGVESTDTAEIPDEAALLEPLADAPLVVAWCKFKKQTMSALMHEIYAYARSIKNDIMLLANPSTIRGFMDQGAMRSTDIWQIGNQAQFLWAEGGNHPGIREGGLVHQVNFFKTAETIGHRVFSTTWKHAIEGNGLADCVEDVCLNTAESAVFGADPGSNWLLRPTNDGELFATTEKLLTDELNRYFNFIKDNSDIFVGSRPVSEIAIYLSAEARCKNYQQSYGGFLTTQQVLLEKNIQFDLLFSEQSEKSMNYSCIIIVDAERLAASEIEFLKAYVKSGGKLLLAGSCDKRLLGANSANIVHCELCESWAEYIKGTYTSCIHLPPDAGNFIAALRKLIGHDLAFEIDSPDYVLSEVRCSKMGTMLLHLLNYQNTVLANDVKISVDTSRIAGGIRCVLLNPDSKEKTELTGILTNNTISYDIPPFKTYSILKFTGNIYD